MMQFARHIQGVLAVLAAAVGPPCAHADVYLWVDASGTMNLSNLSPPEGASITSIIASPPKSAAQEEAARDAARRVEMQALSDRVTRLQNELEQSRRYASLPPPNALPPDMSYAPFQAPQYASWAPPPISYVEDASPPQAVGCDYAWGNCGFGWGAWPYLPAVVVLGGNNLRRGNPIHGNRPAFPRPHGQMHAFAGARRG